MLITWAFLDADCLVVENSHVDLLVIAHTNVVGIGVSCLEVGNEQIWVLLDGFVDSAETVQVVVWGEESTWLTLDKTENGYSEHA